MKKDEKYYGCDSVDDDTEWNVFDIQSFFSTCIKFPKANKELREYSK